MSASVLDLEPIGTTKYTVAQVESALAALALNGGNATRTAEATGIPKSTLLFWRDTQYPNRYHHAATELAPHLEAAIITSTRQAIIHASTVEAKLLERLNDEAENLDKKELAGALRNVSTSKAINADKLLSLTGRPTNITEHRTVDQALAKLGSIVGTAELVSETPTAHVAASGRD